MTVRAKGDITMVDVSDGKNGTNGKDGVNGKDGAPGPAGPPGPAGTPGKDGAQGPAGTPGKDGKDGTNGRDGQMLFATCATAQTVAAKVATLASGSPALGLVAGASVSVRMTYANVASGGGTSALTLDVAGTGAKPIMTCGSNAAFWAAGSTVTFVYDGTNWQVASVPVYASTVDVGDVSGLHVHIGDGSIQNMNGGRVMTKSTNDGYYIYAHDDNTGKDELVGRFYRDGEGSHLESGDIAMRDDFHKLGVIGRLYNDTLANALAFSFAGVEGITLGNASGHRHGVMAGVWGGTKVVKSNGTSTPFMSSSEFKSITGYDNPSIKWVLLAQSADWNAYQGCINLGVQGSTINMYLSRSTTGNVRVNYLFLYFPYADSAA